MVAYLSSSKLPANFQEHDEDDGININLVCRQHMEENWHYMLQLKEESGFLNKSQYGWPKEKEIS